MIKTVVKNEKNMPIIYSNPLYNLYLSCFQLYYFKVCVCNRFKIENKIRMTLFSHISQINSSKINKHKIQFNLKTPPVDIDIIYCIDIILGGIEVKPRPFLTLNQGRPLMAIFF